jgi:hypothetical protein
MRKAMKEYKTMVWKPYCEWSKKQWKVYALFLAAIGFIGYGVGYLIGGILWDSNEEEISKEESECQQ